MSRSGLFCYTAVMPFTDARPDPIRTNRDNWFAWNTMQNRLPDNIRHTARIHENLSGHERQALLSLADAIATGESVPEPSWTWHDYEWWAMQYEPHAGVTWHDSPWFFSETYAFRLILEACRFWEHGRDPFWYTKRAELDTGAAFGPLTVLPADDDGTTAVDRNRRLQPALHLATWGNRADLSFSAGAEPDRDHGTDDLLIIRQDAEAADILQASACVHIVGDNSGAELAGDLVLVRELLRSGVRIVYHVKSHPTYVSDTTVADFHYFLQRASGSSSVPVQRLAAEISEGFSEGRLRLRPDDYWCSTLFLSNMPERIRRTLSSADSIIVKGDFNYRRVFQDTIWHTGVSLTDATGARGLPPFVLLRSMKSDVVWGLDREQITSLFDEDPTWRINGKRALIQCLRFA